MNKYFLALAVLFFAVTSQAQTTDKNRKPTEAPTQVVDQADQPSEPAKAEVATSKPSSGDFYEGFTRKIMDDRMIPPHGLEVTYGKTCHVIFPASIAYVDLGSSNIIAAKAVSANNVLRVKSAVKGFDTETNFSVITEEGNFYSFNVRYADEPSKLNVEMKDFTHDGEAVNRPNNSLEIYLKELGNESPKLVYLINKSIHKENKRIIKHIGSDKFSVQFTLRSIYTHDGLIYLHTQIKNKSNVQFDVDFIRMKIVDKKLAKRTAIQETVIYPVRAYNNLTQVRGKSAERTVYAVEKITIPDGKQLVIELFEKNGGRHQSVIIENSDLVRAREINKLKFE